jgi:hypothetical protein
MHLVRAIVEYGTPSMGSAFARMASLFSSNKQILAMVPNENLSNLASEWREVKPVIPEFCAYETRQTLGMILILDALIWRILRGVVTVGRVCG